ncbi:MAG: Rieske 2Fe-2S domain-containing protein [Actinomycetales bacterium]
MLTAEENSTLTEVGPNTPMGRMMRRFWVPICTSAQVAENDSDPLRAPLLGENFIVFRDTKGRVGVMDEGCMHRGVSLALGRVEDCGIRCLYHGWKFAVDGTIMETPNNSSEKFLKRQKAPAYPAREAGGLIWTYIGPKTQEPPFPHWDFMNGPDENRAVIRLNTQANYLQLFEGGCDSSHVGVLHSNQANPTWMHGEFSSKDEDFNPGALASADNAPTLEIEDTAFGYHYAAKRKLTDGGQSVRVMPVILPFVRVIPAAAYQFFAFEVPRDTNSTSTYLVAHGTKPIDRDEIIRIMGLTDTRFWNDDDCNFTVDWSNRMGQDRARMATDWTGFDGIEQEDAVLAVSCGPVVDRTKEHMVAADRAVIHLRARLLESVRRNEEDGDPICVEIANLDDIRCAPDTPVEEGQHWRELVPGNASHLSAPYAPSGAGK